MIDYFEEVKKLITNQYGLEEETIEEDSKLDSDLNISELDMEDLATILEQKYQITIPEVAYSNFKQVSDIATYLYENVDQA
jgi:acyl carrier protein